MKDLEHLKACLWSVCHEGGNPLAWFDLHKAGLTVEVLEKTVAETDWQGPKPKFDKAPDKNGKVWKFLEESRQ